MGPVISLDVSEKFTYALGTRVYRKPLYDTLPVFRASSVASILDGEKEGHPVVYPWATRKFHSLSGLNNRDV